MLQNRRILCLFIFLLILTSGFFISLGMAQEAPDGAMRRSAGTDMPLAEAHPTSETVYYHIYLRDVRIGKAILEIRQEGEDVVVNFTANPRNTMQNIYRANYNAQVTLSLDPVRPNHAVVEEISGSKNKTTLIEFPEPYHATSVQIESRKGKKPKRQEKDFVSESFVLDPFSAIVLMRGLQWQVGNVEVVDLFTGNKPYELAMFCSGETTLEVDGRMREAWEIVPQTRSFEEPREVKLSGYVIYLAKDPSREILRITGKPKLGRMIAYMSKHDKIDK